VQAACGGIDAEMQEAEVPVSSIDQHDIGNQLAVVDYVEDIYTFYRKIEVSSAGRFGRFLDGSVLLM
jgi:cyclin B